MHISTANRWKRWCHNYDLWKKDSFQQWGPRLAQIACWLKEDEHMHALWFLAQNLQQLFSKNRVAKSQRAISTFCVWVIRGYGSWFWFKISYFDCHCILEAGCPTNWEKRMKYHFLSNRSFCAVRIVHSETDSGCYHLASKVVSWLVANQPLSVTSSLIIQFLRSPL